jgi:hypothetical protein
LSLNNGARFVDTYHPRLSIELEEQPDLPILFALRASLQSDHQRLAALDVDRRLLPVAQLVEEYLFRHDTDVAELAAMLHP